MDEFLRAAIQTGRFSAAATTGGCSEAVSFCTVRWTRSRDSP